MGGSGGIATLPNYNFEVVKLKVGRSDEFRVTEKGKTELTSLKSFFQATGNSAAIQGKGAAPGLSDNSVHWLNVVQSQATFNKATVDLLKESIELSKAVSEDFESKIEKYKLVKAEEETATEDSQEKVSKVDAPWKDFGSGQKLKDTEEPKEITSKQNLAAVDPEILPERNKYTKEFTTDQLSEIRRTMTSLDAQMQRAIAYFSTENGKPLELKTPDAILTSVKKLKQICYF